MKTDKRVVQKDALEKTLIFFMGVCVSVFLENEKKFHKFCSNSMLYLIRNLLKTKCLLFQSKKKNSAQTKI